MIVPSAEEANEAFTKMIDSMAAQVWNCSRCLSAKHSTADCTGRIRCWACSQLGHIRKNCTGAKTSFHWVAKTPSPVLSAVTIKDSAKSLASPVINPKPSSPATLPIPCEATAAEAATSVTSATMANFPIDPARFTPTGMFVDQPWGDDERPARMYVTATAAPIRRNES